MAVLEFSKIIRGKYATLFTEFGKGNKVQLTRKGTRISLSLFPSFHFITVLWIRIVMEKTDPDSIKSIQDKGDKKFVFYNFFIRFIII